MQDIHDVQLIILAAGKGKRMKSNLPKVLLPLHGKPFLHYLLEAVEKSSVFNHPTIVVGVGANLVKKEAGPKYHYAVQEEQLGTGHAVKCAEKLLRGKVNHIMVLYGDHPLVDHTTIDKIAKAHVEGANPITMATAEVGDFNDWRAGFYDYGRVIRNDGGKLMKIVEKKDSTAEELEKTEVNPSYFCFKADWLWEHLAKLSNKNAQEEYYLTELPGMARNEGAEITTVSIDPVTALGANTPEQLKTLEKLMEERS